MHSSQSARFRRVRRISALLGLITLTLGVLAPAASAAPAPPAAPSADSGAAGARQAHTRQAHTRQAHTRQAHARQAHARQAKAVWDAPAPARRRAQTAAGCPEMTRFTDCETRTGRVLWLVDGVPQGEADYRSMLELSTKVNSAAFTVKLTIQVQGSSLPAGSAADFEPDCDHPCYTNSSLTGSMDTGATYSTTFNYTDTTRSHHEPKLTVTITPRIPEAESTTPGRGVLQLRVRCDDEFDGPLPGCVNPAYIPTMTTMIQLPDIATNIRGIQKRGGYGVPGKPATALHREPDPAKQDQNRRQVCDIRITGPRPAGKSCDEYPFASTKEGGNTLPSFYRGWAFVPSDQQNRQAGFITGFYKQNRVINNDPFYVQV